MLDVNSIRPPRDSLFGQELRQLRRYVLVSKSAEPKLEEENFEWIYEVPAGASAVRVLIETQSPGLHIALLCSFMPYLTV